MNEFLALMRQQWLQTSWMEITAVIFGMLQVLLAFRNSILTYPAGIISTAIYTWMLAQPHPGLYADASLNLYYLVMSFYGWIMWGKGKKEQEKTRITRWSRNDRLTAFAIAAAAFILLYIILSSFTPSTVPFWDSIVSATAWSGMWLLAKRKVENWLLLNISNIIAIPLFIYKGMPLTAMLTLFLFTVAVFGYFRWKKLAVT